MDQTVFILDFVLAFSTVALIVGFVVYQARKSDWVAHHGRRIIATITSIQQKSGRTRLGWQHDNYYITAQWTSLQTGKTYTFLTWALDERPCYQTGNLIPVMINPHNPRQYVMEI
jgi:hypothetical protein